MSRTKILIPFQPTPSARRVTIPKGFDLLTGAISTHTLRKEGDDFLFKITIDFLDISTHTLRKEGDSKSIQFNQ